ncbi:MAG: outer membrane beta-barrel protein, partial [Bacteroidota bacterium]
NQSDPTYSGNANTGFTAVNAASAPGFNAGAIYNVNFGNTVGIRPAVTVAVENTDIDYTRRSGAGGPPTIETVAVKGTSVNVSLPLIIRFSSGNIAPYLTLGGTFSYLFSQNSSSAEILPVKKSLGLAGGGLGVDIGIPKSGIIIAPELRYSAGLSDIKDNAATTPASAALSSLKRNTFSLSVSLRKR